MVAPQGLRHRISHGDGPACIDCFTFGNHATVSLAEGHRAAHGDCFLLKVRIPVHIQIQHFTPAKAGIQHHHGGRTEVVLRIGCLNQLPLPDFKASSLSLRWLRHLRRAANHDTILQSCSEDTADRGSKLVDVALRIACQRVVKSLNIGGRDTS